MLRHIKLQTLEIKDSAVEFFPHISFASFSTILFLPSKGIGPMYAWRRGFGVHRGKVSPGYRKTDSTFFKTFRRL
jgi:hypothetical protein